MTQDFYWWRDGIIYQIYPRSFADSNGDGFGDLTGIISKLDYLSGLGIDAIWISPFYPSPDIDFGYDISDHTAVDPRYGTMADFDHLVAEAHRRGIRVVLDVVLNHTSDQHPWFVESRSDRENSKRDWYIWLDPSNKGKPPNNWKSFFGGSNWEFDPRTGQYYFHTFAKQQPDVNWRNPQVRKAQLDVFRFWLERGVDGFRLDVFNAYFKDARFRDNPFKLGLRGFDRQQHVYDINQPEIIPFLQELRALLDSYPERYAVGETFASTRRQSVDFAGSDRLHEVFSFDMIGSWLKFKWDPAWLMERIIQRDMLFDNAQVWPTTVMSNHDKPRTASRYARFDEDDSDAFAAMTLLLTLRGTPFLYYGEEIGMRDLDLKRGEIMDPPGRKYWPIYKGRDGCRSPMQWSGATFAGFSMTQPWLKVHPNHVWRNVAAQQADPNSLLNFTRRLISLRKARAALCRGNFRCFFRTDQGVLAYERELDDDRVLVFINFTGWPKFVNFVWDADPFQAELLLSTAGRTDFWERSPFLLYPHEILLLGL
ncbi:MAG TPA: alpha-glucosidase [Anaerolineales bacterium]|jgi:alpha-glucosidase